MSYLNAQIVPTGLPLAWQEVVRACGKRGHRSLGRGRGWLLRASCVLVLLMGSTVSGWSQLLDVPVDVQVPLFLKATTYDRTFATKTPANGAMVVGIAYQGTNRVSVQEMEALKVALTKPGSGFRIEVVPMAIKDGEDLANHAAWDQLSAIYLTSMRGLKLDAVLAQARARHVLSVTTQAEWVSKGVTMGFELVGSRPKFAINRKSAVAEGCDFSSQLLKLATVY